MTLGDPSGDEGSDGRGLVTLPWVTPALFVLAGAAALGLILTDRVLAGVLVAVAAAVALVLTLIFRSQLQAFNRRRAAAGEASYGTATLFGVGWVILGVWRLTSPAADVVLGIVMIAFGLLMVLAYAPEFFRRRSLARSR